MKSLTLLPIAVLLAACSNGEQSSGPALLGYQDCRIEMREHFVEQGLHPSAADMKSKSTCEERFKSGQARR